MDCPGSGCLGSVSTNAEVSIGRIVDRRIVLWICPGDPAGWRREHRRNVHEYGEPEIGKRSQYRDGQRDGSSPICPGIRGARAESERRKVSIGTDSEGGLSMDLIAIRCGWKREHWWRNVIMSGGT
jgi:hypothetical protein